jgi:hypothetical protein
MANITITALLENIFRARDTVAAEPTGFIQSVLLNTSKEGVSIGGTVTSFRTPQPTLNTSYTPSMTIPDGDAQTVAVDTMAITGVANVRIAMTGEQTRQLDNTAGYQEVIDDMFAQAMRRVRNAIEAHVGTIAAAGSSRAFGTAGTTPFATTIDAIADVRKILIDNGTPFDGMNSLVLDTTAGTALRKVPNLYKANEAASDVLLRRGELLNLMGLSIKESAGVATVTAGTGASATTDATGYAVGVTVLTLASVGTGTLLAGDVITFAGDTNKYVIVSGDADVSNGGTITLAAPGLKVAMSAATKAITMVATHASNIAFHKNAIELVVRPPLQPFGGDAAVDRITIQDFTGMVYEVAQYKGYGKSMFDISTYYQAKVWKPEFVATLLG